MTLASLAERIAGYNNEILVATAAMSPGTNQPLSTEKRPPLPIPSTDRPSIPGSQLAKQNDSQQPPAADPAQATPRSMLQGNSHEDTKTLLTIAAIGAGIIYYLSLIHI